MPIKLPKFKLPSFLSLPSRARQPETIIKPRTGDARWVPAMTTFGRGKSGTTVQQANRIDDVSIRDLDRARLYPTVKDSLNTLLIPLLRAEFTFKCDRQEIADLASQELRPQIRGMQRNLIKPGKNFGWSVIWPRWEPKFDVTLTSGQTASGEKGQRYYPFIWRIEDFYSFSPHDTRLMIDTRTGRFGGVRQNITPRFPNTQVILARECVHYVNDQEFDGNYGVAVPKAAIPFIEAAESVWDSMVLASAKFSDPTKTIYYPMGTTPIGVDGNGKPIKINNSELAMQIASAAEGGSTQCFPSDPWPNSSTRRWELQFQDPGTGTDPFTPRLNLLNTMIRIAIAVPQVATSDMPDSGTYNLGSAVIDLLLDNLQADLDQFENVLNKQLLPLFVLYNFGSEAPPLYIRFQPLDFDTARMCLQALMTSLSQGEPIAETEEGTVVLDKAKIAEDAGLATKLVPKSQAQTVADAVADRLRSSLESQQGGGNPKEQEDK